MARFTGGASGPAGIPANPVIEGAITATDIVTDVNYAQGYHILGGTTDYDSYNSAVFVLGDSLEAIVGIPQTGQEANKWNPSAYIYDTSSSLSVGAGSASLSSINTSATATSGVSVSTSPHISEFGSSAQLGALTSGISIMIADENYVDLAFAKSHINIATLGNAISDPLINISSLYDDNSKGPITLEGNVSATGTALFHAGDLSTYSEVSAMADTSELYSTNPTGGTSYVDVSTNAAASQIDIYADALAGMAASINISSQINGVPAPINITGDVDVTGSFLVNGSPVRSPPAGKSPARRTAAP